MKKDLQKEGNHAKIPFCVDFLMGILRSFLKLEAGEMLTELSTSQKVVGIRQVKRAVEGGKALAVWLASDADPQLLEPIAALCAERGIPTRTGETMKALGMACALPVGAAVAATVAG